MLKASRMVRHLSAGARRLNDSKPKTIPKPVTVVKPAKPVTPPVPVTPAPVVKSSLSGLNSSSSKKFSFTGFLVKTAVVSGIVYGSVLYAATKNEKVMDFVIDQQLPFYEPVIDVIEHGTFEDLKAYLNDVSKQLRVWETRSKDQISEITSKSEKIFEETRNKFSGSAKGATPLEQLQKPVEAVQKVPEHLPMVKFNAEGLDDSIKQTIDSFNHLIASIDLDSLNAAAKESLVKAIGDNVSKLSAKLDSLTKNFDAEVQAKLKQSLTELLTSYTKKELEMTETLLEQFNREKSQLETKLNAKLKQEIEAAKQTISQAAVNAVLMVRVEQTKQFSKLIKESVDNERNGRLAGLEQLNAKLKELEEFSVSLESQLVSNHNKTVLLKAISNFKHVLNANDSPKVLAQYFAQIDKAAAGLNNELLNLALADLRPLVAQESSVNLLSYSQLLSKWDALTPELRSASLLPPNAGFLGHLASIVFSKLLVPVKGAKPEGKDIESVIGRIEFALTKGELDVAVEEAANLKGWPRKLADDWVRDGRKRLEVQFLVGVLDSEARVV